VKGRSVHARDRHARPGRPAELAVALEQLKSTNSWPQDCGSIARPIACAFPPASSLSTPASSREPVVVDNGSTDASATLVRERFPTSASWRSTSPTKSSQFAEKIVA
jgi:hypothetical protein